jgi:exonuclease III
VFKAASNFTLLNWNVRGLNAPVKRSDVQDMVKAVHAMVVCIQETKLSQIDARTVTKMLGPKF